MSTTVHKPATKKLALCPSCGAAMKTIDYKVWGTKRFSPSTGFYEDDDSPGNSDMEFTCPNCSCKLDPEGLVF